MSRTGKVKMKKNILTCLNCTLPVNCCTGEPRKCLLKYERYKTNRETRLCAELKNKNTSLKEGKN